VFNEYVAPTIPGKTSKTETPTTKNIFIVETTIVEIQLASVKKLIQLSNINRLRNIKSNEKF
jgi:hypothetical protein